MKPMPEHRCPAEWPGQAVYRPGPHHAFIDVVRCDLINGHQGGHRCDSGYTTYTWGTGQ